MQFLHMQLEMYLFLSSLVHDLLRGLALSYYQPCTVYHWRLYSCLLNNPSFAILLAKLSVINIHICPFIYSIMVGISVHWQFGQQ